MRSFSFDIGDVVRVSNFYELKVAESLSAKNCPDFFSKEKFPIGFCKIFSSLKNPTFYWELELFDKWLYLCHTPVFEYDFRGNSGSELRNGDLLKSPQHSYCAKIKYFILKKNNEFILVWNKFLLEKIKTSCQFKIDAVGIELFKDTRKIETKEKTTWSCGFYPYRIILDKKIASLWVPPSMLVPIERVVTYECLKPGDVLEHSNGSISLVTDTKLLNNKELSATQKNVSILKNDSELMLSPNELITVLKTD